MNKDEALKLASALDHWATQMDMGRKPDPKSLTRKASAELRRLQAELEATNRQVEILSDALAESRREVAALKALQEPVAWANPSDLKNFDMKVRTNGGPLHTVALCLCTPPAQEFVCSTGLCHYKALPDPIHHTDLSEHPEYISGWNDYRAAMLEMMK